MILEGIIGSMAWRFDGERLQVVWFGLTDHLELMMERGRPFTRKAFASYATIKAAKARYAASARVVA